MKTQINNPEFYVVMREGSTNNTPTYMHTTYESALDEAVRLTRMHREKFHVLCHVASAEVNDVNITEVSIDKMPF